MSTTTTPPDDELILTADDVLADVRSTARAMIRGGFRSFDEVLSRALELAALADDAPRAGSVERVVRQEWDAVAAALEAEAHGASDDVRIEHAFAALERDGVVARLGWSCCAGCGERDLRRQLPAHRGFAFVTEPDLERLAAGTMTVRCSSAAVGRVVATALVDQGLEARAAGAAVVVRVTSWRRRPPRASAA